MDGQQRLITIFIFLKIAQEITRYEPYKIEFETRENSATFLQSLEDQDASINNKNIDYFHITNAYKCIQEWIISREKDGTPRFNILGKMFTTITEQVFFIWYELPDKVEPVEIFTRVNMGKIPLSNAELIKAIIFNSDNFEENSEKTQQEFSLEWDRIERDLQNEAFWYFLVENAEHAKKYATRIDLIFDLLANKYNDELPEKCKIVDQSPDRTFLIVEATYKNAKTKQEKKEFVEKLWKKDANSVYAVHERLVEWYQDLNKYHIIGFLISAGTKIEKIFELSKGKRKSEILTSLIKETKKHVKIGTKEELEELTFNENKKVLRYLFLLFNIATLVCKNEKQYRFPFYLYKEEKWDIEHIHASGDESAEQDDSLGNLTLLSADINRSYKNSPFKDKRKVIVERDSMGKFIPLCTKNVFLKQYSFDIYSMEMWEEKDKQNYVDEMWKILDAFWKEEFVK